MSNEKQLIVQKLRKYETKLATCNAEGGNRKIYEEKIGRYKKKLRVLEKMEMKKMGGGGGGVAAEDVLSNTPDFDALGIPKEEREEWNSYEGMKKMMEGTEYVQTLDALQKLIVDKYDRITFPDKYVSTPTLYEQISNLKNQMEHANNDILRSARGEQEVKEEVGTKTEVGTNLQDKLEKLNEYLMGR